MIQPQELRKGNIIGRYFHNPNPKGATKEVSIGVVMEIREESVNMTAKLGRKERIKLPYESLTPIELTEEWLVKLGFIKDNGSWYKLPLPELCGGQITYIVTEGKIFALVCENEQSFGCKEVAELYNELKEEFDYIPRTSDIWINNIKYVHQLQNLYHSITGQELTIKE